VGRLALDPHELREALTKPASPSPPPSSPRFSTRARFNQGYVTTEYLAAALLDLTWHGLKPADVPAADGVLAFEAAALKKSASTSPPSRRATAPPISPTCSPAATRPATTPTSGPRSSTPPPSSGSRKTAASPAPTATASAKSSCRAAAQRRHRPLPRLHRRRARHRPAPRPPSASTPGRKMSPAQFGVFSQQRSWKNCAGGFYNPSSR